MRKDTCLQPVVATTARSRWVHIFMAAAPILFRRIVYRIRNISCPERTASRGGSGGCCQQGSRGRVTSLSSLSTGLLPKPQRNASRGSNKAARTSSWRTALHRWTYRATAADRAKRQNVSEGLLRAPPGRGRKNNYLRAEGDPSHVVQESGGSLVVGRAVVEGLFRVERNDGEKDSGEHLRVAGEGGGGKGGGCSRLTCGRLVIGYAIQLGAEYRSLS